MDTTHVSISDLDAAQAERIGQWVVDEFGLQPIITDSHDFMVLHLDRDTVLALRRAVSPEVDLEALTDGIDDWLASANVIED